ncbi:DUF502 domain-containing protein [Halomarina oriensis]|uniref:DUF502 domain-containing protein n=1 Tax=Halomarina oriensis TaxID=671145 RepID=A0A6B0GLJ2_9EURY|nr:DUF502 domain-containing protein [Halomarina oriensis]MWG34751.1 DUF502 domain-containing protein [Halomarina oriensis]
MVSLGSWKRDFASGLIVLGPVLVTLYILRWLFVKLAGLGVISIDPTDMPDGWEAATPYVEVGLLLAVLLLLTLSVGYMMRTTFGNLVESGIDSSMNRLPGLRVVYNASKMAVETAVSGPEDLQSPVKVETWNGMRMTAFKTGKKSKDGRELLFLPTAPNITTGFVVEVEPNDYTEVDETVEDALTRILSAGFGDAKESGVHIDVEEEMPTLHAGRGTTNGVDRDD